MGNKESSSSSSASSYPSDASSLNHAAQAAGSSPSNAALYNGGSNATPISAVDDCRILILIFLLMKVDIIHRRHPLLLDPQMQTPPERIKCLVNQKTNDSM